MLHSTELLRFRRTAQRRGLALAIADNLGDDIEVPGANLALMLRRRVTIAFGREFRFLQHCICRHAMVAVIARQIKHAGVEGMKSSERNKLKLVTHRPELALKLCDAGTVQFLLPIERRRTIVSQ